MPSWDSPAVLAESAKLWEYLISLQFDINVIQRKKRMTMALVRACSTSIVGANFQLFKVPYFLARYLLLFSLAGVTTSLNSNILYALPSPSNSFKLTIIPQTRQKQLPGLLHLQPGQTSLALFDYALIPSIALAILVLAQWALVIRALSFKQAVIGITSIWDSQIGCIVTSSNQDYITFIITLSVLIDFVTMALTAVKFFAIYRHQRRDLGGDTTISRVFKDGISYFVVAFLANLLAITFMLLKLNPTMNIMFNTPAAVLTVIMSTRAVRSLALPAVDRERSAQRLPAIFPVVFPMESPLHSHLNSVLAQSPSRDNGLAVTEPPSHIGSDIVLLC
ncbi:hypothetical protein H0H93_008965 [Arthromyces matolae]|nr:hypothetical protein H0H93_008965 [Arthromyces matolae]